MPVLVLGGGCARGGDRVPVPVLGAVSWLRASDSQVCRFQVL